jgi:hypothetical protein
MSAKERQARYYTKNKAAILAKEYRRREGEDYKEYIRNYHLIRDYGITLEEYKSLISSQNSTCAICLTTEPGGRHGTWYLDHDHQTKKVRGVLCHHCNVGLGHFKDNVEVLSKAIHYLERNRNENSN